MGCHALLHLSNPGVEPESSAASALQADSLPLSHLGSPNSCQDIVNQSYSFGPQFCWGWGGAGGCREETSLLSDEQRIKKLIRGGDAGKG